MRKLKTVIKERGASSIAKEMGFSKQHLHILITRHPDAVIAEDVLGVSQIHYSKKTVLMRKTNEESQRNVP